MVRIGVVGLGFMGRKPKYSNSLHGNPRFPNAISETVG